MTYALEQPNAGSYLTWGVGFADHSAFAIYSFDWSTDYCSFPPDSNYGPPGLDCHIPCARHDFGYRNFRVEGVFSQYEGMVDGTFYWDMAYVYWAAVSVFGG